MDFIHKAVKSAADWNRRLNQDKKEKRQAYFDMQTFNIHYPMNNRGKMKVTWKLSSSFVPVVCPLTQPILVSQGGTRTLGGDTSLGCSKVFFFTLLRPALAY